MYRFAEVEGKLGKTTLAEVGVGSFGLAVGKIGNDTSHRFLIGFFGLVGRIPFLL